MRPTPERKQQQTPSGTPAGQPQTTTFNAKALPQNTSRQVSWLDCTDNAPSQAPRAQWSTGEAIWQNYSCATARDSHAIPSWLPHYRAKYTKKKQSAPLLPKNTFPPPPRLRSTPRRPSTALVLTLFMLKQHIPALQARFWHPRNALKSNSPSHPLPFPSGSSYVLLMYFLCISYVLNINST